ncbi:MAG TPA: carboxypeptidase regulatory-like domain-containing protein [Streptosporangiaceae bacterium]|jgi:N-acetylneuraminic acid mutarotase
MALVRTNVKAHEGITPNTAPSGYGPADLQSAYKLPSSTAGSGETVAIVDAGDDPTAETDLGMYRAQYGLPPCTTANGCFEKVNQEGQQASYPPVNGTWPVEESLDIDMVSAACPDCHILLVEANSADDSDMYAAEDEAVALGAKYISNSWSGAESSTETQDDTYFDHPGVVITASAGDDGYGVGYPSASQYVTAVGGTTLTQDASVPRGWDETVWGSASGGKGTGSGCSAYEPKPTWQKDTGCANRTVADVSADANPNTGVAIYATSGGEDGWLVVGGTSVSSPFIASVYALAGSPVAGTYPSSYPYADPSGLNDITSGANSTCSPSYLCTAGPGYDGPTGLGTPDGVDAFSGGPHGDVTGQVTDGSTGKPLAGAQVSADGGSTVTNSGGDYDLTLPAGTYDVTAADYGYNSKTTGGVTVTNTTTTTTNFPLAAEPTATINGTVTDGSGHDWPLYATVAAEGTPGAPVYTNPYTGAYSVTLPQNATYTLQVTPVQPGYQTTTQQVSLGTSGVTQNVSVPTDTSTCDAPGYAFEYTGSTETFTGWTGSTPQDGWTVTDNNGSGETWLFGNSPTGEGEPSGSDGQFAIADSYHYDYGNTSLDTSLVSPVENLSGDTSPVIQFDTDLAGVASASETADVDLSLDGGSTWTTIWQNASTTTNYGLVSIPITQAAGQPDVQVRFHYYTTPAGGSDLWWSLDNVFIGNLACDELPGGMMAGVVRDGNTGDPVDGIRIASVKAPSSYGVSATTPGDPHLPDGFYEFFSPMTGTQKFTAADIRYQSQTKVIDVLSDAVAQADFTLPAGELSVTPDLAGTVKMGDTVKQDLTITNHGKMAAQVTIGQQGASLTSAVSGAVRRKAQDKDVSWVQIPSYASGAEYNVAGYDDANGKVYSAGGGAVSVNTTAVYDPQTGLWSSAASMPIAVTGATAQFINGEFYVFGGVTSNILEAPKYNDGLQTYNPVSNKWQVRPGGPAGSVAFAASAVLDGDLYVVGGCPQTGKFLGFPFPVTYVMCNASASDSASRYDPATGKWTPIASYPLSASNLACGGISGELVCTGGLDNRKNNTNPKAWVTDKSTYIYNPVTNTWSQGADLPIGLWGMSYGAANGQLLVSDGITDHSTEGTTRSFTYQPSTNTWKRLPNTPAFRFMGGSACGFFQIGGINQSSSAAASEELPGYDACGDDGTQVPWLAVSPSQVTVPAGGTVALTVTLNGGAAGVTQPGAYTAELNLINDTPYATPSVAVTMNVTPPRSWGEITGTVSATACKGTHSPLSGATVQIDSWAGDDTLTTGTSGQYQLWLDRRSNPLTLIVTKNGWRSQTRKMKITAGQAATADFTLTRQACS